MGANGQEADAAVPYPPVSVVMATRDRPQLLRRAVEAALHQDYPGVIQCVIVFDRSEPVPLDLGELAPGRETLVLRNMRTPGLAGARNTGIEAAAGELIAFCDDDDEWHPTKLRQQFDLLSQRPDAAVVATGIRIVTDDAVVERRAPASIGFADLLESRVAEIHPSSYLLRRDLVLDTIGLVDEELPASYGEDYEFLLRAARVGEIACVPDPLVNIYWNRPSFFAARWDSIAAGLAYILERVPEFADAPRGRARIEGQIAFALAARRRRREAFTWIGRTLRNDPRQLRAYAAIAVALRLVSAGWLVRRVQATGRGL